MIVALPGLFSYLFLELLNLFGSNIQDGYHGGHLERTSAPEREVGLT